MTKSTFRTTVPSLKVTLIISPGVTERTHEQHPTDREVLMALITIARDTGDFPSALQHARELLTVDPSDVRLRALVSDLEKKAVQ
jgi:hypothetical protein